MKLNFDYKKIATLFVVVFTGYSCLLVQAESSSVVYAGFELKGGKLFSKNHKVISAPSETINQFTVSPDSSFIVYVLKEPTVALWILNVKTGKKLQIGKNLGIGCCTLLSNVDNKGFGDTVSLVNGAFWSKKNEVLVSTLEGKGGAMEFFLSMNGELHGDI